MAAGACQGCPSSRLPWTVRDQPSLCWMTRAGSEAKREVCWAGAMEANACPRRGSASVAYTTVCRLWVRMTAMEGYGPRRRPETRTMLVVAGEEPMGAKLGTEEAGVATGAGGRGGARQGGLAEEGWGGEWRGRGGGARGFQGVRWRCGGAKAEPVQVRRGAGGEGSFGVGDEFLELGRGG